jgi:DNA adenine methylase
LSAASLAIVSRPALRAHGAKWTDAPRIIAELGPHDRYIEPFCYSAAVLFRKPRSRREVIGDVNGQVTNVFRVLRNRSAAAELRRLLELTPYSEEEFRAAREPHGDQVEQARRTLVRSFMASRRNMAPSAGFRFSGSNTCPSRQWANLPACVEEFTRRLQGVVIHTRPAVDVIVRHDRPDGAIYADPPYPHSTRSGIRWPAEGQKYYGAEMSDDDHRALAKALRACRGRVVISGHPCELYDVELYPDWRRVQWTSSRSDAEEPRTEVIWINGPPPTPPRRPQLSLLEVDG